MGQLDDRVAVITGGGSGIGLESARLFCHEGARVHLIGLQGELLEEAVDSLGPERASASVADVTDVTDEGAVHDAIESGYERFGRLDVLFSNAGVSGAVRPIVDYPADVFARTWRCTSAGRSTSSSTGSPGSPTAAA